MAIALVLVEFFLSTERTLRDGVLAALDRLARKPVLNVIANWRAPTSTRPSAM